MNNTKAVILAGGKGTRLGPYTTVLPKPLLPIGDQSILEVVVSQLRGCGFTDMVFAVGYLSHLIQAVFGDGADRDVSIQYHHEREPLGTAGALATIDGLDDTFLMMNGDVLTALDYAELVAAHRASGNELTVATHRRVVRSEYGVLHLGGPNGETQSVVGYEEKPEMPCMVSMGVYVVEPSVLDLVPDDEPFDVPDLVLDLLARDRKVGAYEYDGFWLDIGRHDDYERAIAEYETLKPMLFRELAPA